MKPWCGSLSQWFNGLLIHGLSGLGSTISENKQRVVLSTMMRGCREGKALGMNWCCICCIFFSSFWRVWKYSQWMCLCTYTHLFVFKCIFSLHWHRKVKITTVNNGIIYNTWETTRGWFHKVLWKKGLPTFSTGASIFVWWECLFVFY